MRKYLAALVAVALLTLPLPIQAEEVPCPDPARPHHYSVLCLTDSEYLALGDPQPISAPPTPVYVAPVDLVRQLAYYYWPDWAAERMVRIARCESGYDPNAQHPGSKAAGLWQIMPFHQNKWPGDYFNPWTNAAVAYQIWLDAYQRTGNGFRPWVCKG